MPYSQTLKDRATQLLIKYKSGALVTQIGTVTNKTWTLVSKLVGNMASENTFDHWKVVFSRGKVRKGP